MRVGISCTILWSNGWKNSMKLKLTDNWGDLTCEKIVVPLKEIGKYWKIIRREKIIL